MRAYIDGEILSDFISKQPASVPLGSVDDNDAWNSFWRFCKNEVDLLLCKASEIKPEYKLFLTSLTTGRNNTTIEFQDDYRFQYKEKIKKDIPASIFYLNEKDDNKKRRYVSQNSVPIAFVDNYWENWLSLSLIGLRNEVRCPLRPNGKYNLFSNWEQLNKYIVPFQDALFIDSYIFSDLSLIASNFEKIIVELDNVSSTKKNLTIITAEIGTTFNQREDIYEKIKTIKVERKLNLEIALVFLSKIKKEHDRQIFTNFTNIKSGDSFNYFNSKGDIITKGTEIEFYSMIEWRNRNALAATTEYLNKNLDVFKKSHSDTHFFGSNNNGLLEFA